MNTEFNTLLKKLITSYYNGSFEDTLNDIVTTSPYSKEETISILSSLCGVSVPKGDNPIYDLKKAITYKTVEDSIVSKVKSCSMDCIKDANGNTPCQAACPVNAIILNPLTNSTCIDSNICMECGMCVNVCKNNSYLDKINILPLLDLLKNNSEVIALVAPAISGQFGENISMDMLREFFIELGFKDMVEVAFAADILTLKEAYEFNKLVNTPNDLMITSCCCPMWVGMLKRVYKDLVSHVSPSVSPMVAAGRIIKKLNPSAKTVFIGPCIAKKAEAKDKDLCDAIDLVLTFDEVKSLMDSLSISLDKYKGIPSSEYASKGGRLYARTGGVSIAIKEAIEELYPDKANLINPIAVHGVKECKDILNSALSKNINANFIEGMGCIGGCVGGPKTLITKDLGKTSVDDYAINSPIKVATHSKQLDLIFNKLGINSIDDLGDEDKTYLLHREF